MPLIGCRPPVVEGFLDLSRASDLTRAPYLAVGGYADPTLELLDEAESGAWRECRDCPIVALAGAPPS